LAGGILKREGHTEEFDRFGLSKELFNREVWKTRARYATGDELDRLRAFMGRQAWMPCRLMLETGIRVGDAVKARRCDFYRSPDGSPHFRWIAEKTGKEGDSIISEQMFAFALSGDRPDNAWVFPGRGKAGHITRQAVWARIKTAAKFVSIDAAGVSPHTMRKVAAVQLRRSCGFRAAKAALQHSYDATAALYAYADAMAAPDTPITWGQIEMLAEYVAAKVLDRLDKTG
jgi:integrase